MKLSQLKALVAAMEANAVKHGSIDPEVSFWPTTAAENTVKGLTPEHRGVFVDMEPELMDADIDMHRITVQGKGFGDYSIPLVVYKKKES